LALTLGLRQFVVTCWRRYTEFKNIMKLIKTETINFKKGNLYSIEETVKYPIKYFKKPLFEKDYFDGNHTHKKGEIDYYSNYDQCIKSFKIVRKWYE